MAKPTLGQCSALLCFFFCWCWCCYCCCCCCCCCYYCCYCCVPLIGLRSLFRLGRFALPCLALPCRCYLLSLLLMPVADSAAIAFLPSSSPAKSVIWAPLISYPHPSSAAASSRPPPPLSGWSELLCCCCCCCCFFFFFFFFFFCCRPTSQMRYCTADEQQAADRTGPIPPLRL